jgi:HEAT repeat protein
MKSIRRNKKSSTPSPATAAGPRGRGRRFEWPLLAFPAAVLATLVVLYVVNHSIQHQEPAYPADVESAPAVRAPAARATNAPAVTDDSTRRLPGTRIDSEPGEAPQVTEHPASTQGIPRRRAVTREPVTQDGAGRRAGLQALDEPGRIILILQEAIQENDHARIKQCLDDLVALGDQVIAPLTQVIAREQGEVGMWAAEALARIGSPLATTTLLDTLAGIKEGLYKEELGKRIAGINNHESWPVLLDNVLSTADSTVLRAAGEALSRMADTPIVDELIARFDGATDVRDTERIAQLIANIRSSKATGSLISLAGDVASAPQDALARAALEGLAKTGDPQAISYLMRKLEATPPGENGYLVNTISEIKEPQAYDALLYAAAGNKEVSAEGGRTAAIYALRNFPDAKTYSLLEQIVATEQNARVVAAATRTLDDLRRTSPHIVANAQSLVKKDAYTAPELIKK